MNSRVINEAPPVYGGMEVFDQENDSGHLYLKTLIDEVEPIMVKPLKMSEISARKIDKWINSCRWQEGSKPTILQVWHQYLVSNSFQIMETAARNGQMLKVWPVDIPQTDRSKNVLSWEMQKPLENRVATCPNLLTFLYMINLPLKRLVTKRGAVVTSWRALPPKSDVSDTIIFYHRKKWFWLFGKMYASDREIADIPELFDNGRKTFVLLFAN